MCRIGRGLEVLGFYRYDFGKVIMLFGFVFLGV